MWEKCGTAGQATDDYQRMRTACLTTTTTNTHSEYVILIAFPLQHWSQERASIFGLYLYCVLFIERKGRQKILDQTVPDIPQT